MQESEMQDEKSEVVYVFVPAGRCPHVSMPVASDVDETAEVVHLRIGRKVRPGDWKRGFHGLNTVFETLLEVRVEDARTAMSKLVDILRGNVYFGSDPRMLGGWREGRLMEDNAFGNSWWMTNYSMSRLREIFRTIAWELGGRVGPAPGSGTQAESADAVRVQQAGPEVLIGPVSSALAAEVFCGTETGKAFVRDRLYNGC